MAYLILEPDSDEAVERSAGHNVGSCSGKLRTRGSEGAEAKQATRHGFVARMVVSVQLAALSVVEQSRNRQVAKGGQAFGTREADWSPNS